MKIFLSYFLSIFILLAFSCKSSPDAKDRPEKTPSDAVEQPLQADLSDLSMEEESIGVIETAEETAEEYDDIVVETVEAEPVVTEPPVVTAVIPPPMPPVPPPSPPVPPLPPPAQRTPLQEAPPEQEPPAEPEEKIAEEPAPAPASPNRGNIPDYPATRLDSPAQMGMTPKDKEIIYSRIVHAATGQTIEIPFRGNGWVYLGEIASRRGISYNSRRNESDGQSFIFSLEEAGVYTLKFYRQDFLRDFIINDHVQVIVSESPKTGAGQFSPPVDRGKVVAQPRWPSPFEEAQIRSGARLPSEPVVTNETVPSSARSSTQQSAPSAQTPTQRQAQPQTPATQPPAAAQPQASRPDVSSQAGSQTTAASALPPSQEASPETSSAPTKEFIPPDVLLKRAQEKFEGGDVAQSIALLNQYLEDFPGGNDELYWLLGQYYEANSPSRNILLSLDYYRRLVDEYPQSSRLNDARRRIAYLERYYINIQ